VPVIGDRIEMTRGDTTLRGVVEHAENDCVLVRWDEGGASTIRVDRSPPRVLGHYGTSLGISDE